MTIDSIACIFTGFFLALMGGILLAGERGAGCVLLGVGIALLLRGILRP